MTRIQTCSINVWYKLIKFKVSVIHLFWLYLPTFWEYSSGFPESMEKDIPPWSRAGSLWMLGALCYRRNRCQWWYGSSQNVYFIRNWLHQPAFRNGSTDQTSYRWREYDSNIKRPTDCWTYGAHSLIISKRNNCNDILYLIVFFSDAVLYSHLYLYSGDIWPS